LSRAWLKLLSFDSWQASAQEGPWVTAGGGPAGVSEKRRP